MHEDTDIRHCHLVALPSPAVNSNWKISTASCLSQHINSCWLVADGTSNNLWIFFMIKLKYLLDLDWNLVTDIWYKILLGSNMPSSGRKELWLHVSKHALGSWLFLIYCLLYIVWCIHFCLSCFDPASLRSWVNQSACLTCRSAHHTVKMCESHMSAPLPAYATYSCQYNPSCMCAPETCMCIFGET